MALPVSRNDFKNYVMRKLGAPVINIEVSEDQIEDRIDEALSFWRDYHYDASQKVYLKHQITEADILNKYIPIPEKLLGIINVFDINNMGVGMFSPTYQFMLHNINDATAYNMVDYHMAMTHVEFIRETLGGYTLFRFNRRSDKLYIDVDWSAKIKVGNWIVIEAYDILDPDIYAETWQDRILQNYCEALVQEQWGKNLTKFTNAQLSGGNQFNGEFILNEAKEKRRQIEEDIINSFSPILADFIG